MVVVFKLSSTEELQVIPGAAHETSGKHLSVYWQGCFLLVIAQNRALKVPRGFFDKVI